jgi:flagellin-like protein
VVWSDTAEPETSRVEQYLKYEAGTTPGMDRGISSVVAVAALIAVTVVAGAAVGSAVSTATVDPVPRARLSLSVDAGTDRIALAHESGETLSVEDLTLAVRIGGEPLAHQPPVPFFAATGFVSGPTGPFNSAADPRWTAGERATIRLASTNTPTIDPGDRVSVTVRTAAGTVARLETTA